MLGDASRDVSTIAGTDALIVLALLLAAAAGSSVWLGRRRAKSWSVAQWFGGLSTLAFIVAVTLFRDGIAYTWQLRNLGDWSAEGLRQLGRNPLGSSQFVLNVALFVPAGLAWTLMTRRPLRVLGLLAAGSLMIECVQSVTGAGANDAADIVANSVGAALGVGIAHLLGSVARPRICSPRRRLAVVVAGVGGGVLVVAALLAGASQRQDRVAADLEDEFAGTTRTAVSTRLDEDPESVFGAVNPRADGAQYLDNALIVRYPATFFGFQRCVYVVWTDLDVSFDKASGNDCTRFMG